MGQDRHLHQIDALRGIAAAVVAFVYHFEIIGGVRRSGPLDGWPVFTWLHAYGYTAVDLFFVISGVVFAHVYLRADGLKTGTTFGSFTRARIARLYPLHLLTLIVTAGLFSLSSWGDGYTGAWPFALNLLMLQQSGLNDGLSYNIPAWSISVEMICYTVFIAAALIGRRALLRVAIVSILLGIVWSAAPFGPLQCIGRGLLGFFAGLLLWTYRKRFATIRSPVLLVAALAIIAIGIRIPGIAYGASLTLTAWPLIILAAVRSSGFTGQPWRWLGERSYSIYLIHFPAHLAVRVFVFGDAVAPREHWLAASALAIGLTILLAHFSYRYVEQPARRWIHGLGAKPGASPAAHLVSR